VHPVQLRRSRFIAKYLFLFANRLRQQSVARDKQRRAARPLITARHGPTDCYWAVRRLHGVRGRRVKALTNGKREQRVAAYFAIAVKTPPVSVGTLGPQASVSWQMQAWATSCVSSGFWSRAAELPPA
jgi:hypothetical protein